MGCIFECDEAGAITGLNSRAIAEQETPRRVSIRLGCEAVPVGQALGYDIEPIRGIAAERLPVPLENGSLHDARHQDILFITTPNQIARKASETFDTAKMRSPPPKPPVTSAATPKNRGPNTPPTSPAVKKRPPAAPMR